MIDYAPFVTAAPMSDEQRAIRQKWALERAKAIIEMFEAAEKQ